MKQYSYFINYIKYICSMGFIEGWVAIGMTITS